MKAPVSVKPLLPLLLVPILLHQCWFAARIIGADTRYFVAQREVVYWAQEDYRPTPEQVSRLQESMLEALARWPLQADYLSLLARIHLWRGLLAGNRPQANAALEDAITTMEESFTIRPANPYAWAQYAEYLAAVRQRPQDLEQAVARVLQLAPGDVELQERSSALLSR